MPTILIVRPTTAKIAAAVAALDVVNHRQNARTCTPGAAFIMAEVTKHKAGFRNEYNGGGVANAYKYRAYSTSWGWAGCRVDGVKVLRITAERVGCSGRSVSNPMGNRATLDKLVKTGRADEIVLPLARDVVGFVAAGTGDAGRMARALLAHPGPLDPVALAVLCDKLKEDSRPQTAARFVPTLTAANIPCAA